GARGREPPAQEALGGPDAGQRGAQGCALKKLVRPTTLRQAVVYLRERWELSERRACRVVAANRSSIRREPRGHDDEPLRQRLRELAEERRRFGYRRLHVFLRREGVTVNHKRIYRIYRDEGYRCAGEVASVWLEKPGCPCLPRLVRMSSGAWTSLATLWPGAAGSASSASSTPSLASRWRSR